MFRHHRMNPRTLIQIGLFALPLASIANWVLHRQSRASPDWADGLVGLLYGVAIGAMLLGVWKSRRAER